jgi:hypothetical protein
VALSHPVVEYGYEKEIASIFETKRLTMRRSNSYTIYESLERRSANAIGRKTSSRVVKKTAAELREFIFGAPTPESAVPVRLFKTDAELTKTNSEKYKLLANSICSLELINGESYHGRFSKSQNQNTDAITASTNIELYVFKHKKYINVDLVDITAITTNKTTTSF